MFKKAERALFYFAISCLIAFHTYGFGCDSGSEERFHTYQKDSNPSPGVGDEGGVEDQGDDEIFDLLDSKGWFSDKKSLVGSICQNKCQWASSKKKPSCIVACNKLKWLLQHAKNMKEDIDGEACLDWYTPYKRGGGRFSYPKDSVPDLIKIILDNSGKKFPDFSSEKLAEAQLVREFFDPIEEKYWQKQNQRYK